MKDFNKDIFNDSIRNKFSNAEVQPGNAVWEGIEAELLKLDNRKMQKKAAFYRNVAAAVILIAMVSIYFNLQDFKFKSTQESFIPVELEDQAGETFVSRNDVIMAKPNSSEQDLKNDNKAKLFDDDAIAAASGSISEPVKDMGLAYADEDQQTSIYSDDNASFLISKIEGKEPHNFEFSQSEMEVNEVSYFAVSNLDKPKANSALAWNTNVNVGSGSFNPNSEITDSPVNSTVHSLNSPGTAGRTVGNISEVSNSQEIEAVQDLSSAPMRSNVSFTIGLHAGLEINDRWNIKSGLQFGNYRSSSNSSTVIRDRNSDLLYPYHGASSSTEIAEGRVINVTSEYNFYNDFQILSIPLMASYKVIDRKLDIAIVSGATADFILKNTLRGGSDQINEVTFGQNDRQAYKNIFASGIVGIEISYPFADKYALSIMPTYKRAFSNVTTENAAFNSMPAFMGLNMSLAYLF